MREERIDNPCGKLIVIRLPPRMNLEQAKVTSDRMLPLLKSVGKGAVVCMDTRGTQVLPPDVATYFIVLMKANSGILARMGFVYNAASNGLQLQRMIREANSPARRCFEDVVECTAWLGEKLSPDENAALLAFLSFE